MTPPVRQVFANFEVTREILAGFDRFKHFPECQHECAMCGQRRPQLICETATPSVTTEVHSIYLVLLVYFLPHILNLSHTLESHTWLLNVV